MTKTQLLLLTISLIPFINALVVKLWSNHKKLTNSLGKFFPILFLANLIGLYSNLNHDSSSLTLLGEIHTMALSLEIDSLSLKFLFLLNFFWLIFVFYSQHFLQISETKNFANLPLFFTLVVAFINLIIISNNLLSTLFFYNCLLVLCHFFATKFFYKKETKFSALFTFLLYLESTFFFLAIVSTYKFTGQLDYKSGGIIANLPASKIAFLLALYFIGLFLCLIFPCYIFYKNNAPEPLVVYPFFFLAYALSSLYIFLKIIIFTFGFSGFSMAIDKIGFGVFEVIFLLNIATASMLLFLSRGLKSSFFYLFFQQFTFALFAVIFFAKFAENRVGLPLVSFLFSLTLIFLSISNFTLCLSKAENKSFEGIFYSLIISSSLFIFAMANLLGIGPGVGLPEKFFLIKTIFQKKLFISAMIVGLNFIGLVLFSWKIFYPLFLRQGEKKSQSDLDLARTIDFDSSLVLTGLVTAIGIFSGLIIFPFLTP